MGWATGELKGRRVGYAIRATCDWPKCNEKIDRGLAYRCGGADFEDDAGCGAYFCGAHRQGDRRLVCVSNTSGYRYVSVCNDCAKPPSKRRKAALVLVP